MKRNRKMQVSIIVITAVLVASAIGFYMVHIFGIFNRDTPTPSPDNSAVVTTTPSGDPRSQDDSVATSTFPEITVLPAPILSPYIIVTDGCDIHFQGECLRARSGPGTEYPVVAKLRNNIVLKTDGETVDATGMRWYKIIFDEHLQYPERVTSEWYVSASFVKSFEDVGTVTAWDSKDPPLPTTKSIVVNRSEQTLYAYEGETLFMEVPVSTGLLLTPTPRGTFSIFRKTPSRYMQGPLPGFSSDQYYDLPGVPWNLYFTAEGAVIHGAYWHNSFGSAYSHGCVNLPPDKAKELYYWADLGTPVTVKD